MTKPTIVLYHADCYDGFAAAWTARKYYGEANVEFVRGVYGAEPPDVTDREVLMLDFCYPLATMRKLNEQAASLTILDHHPTAFRVLEELQSDDPRHVFYATLDKERSGCGITWDTLFAGEPRPPLLDRVEDRDLWRWKYDDSRLIHAALESYPMGFATWDFLMQRPLPELREEGVRLEALHFNHINLLLPITTRPMRIDGVLVEVANVPITLCSDAGMTLANQSEHGWSATYMDTTLGRQFSLRSTEDGPDVSKIAERLGKRFGTSGGGHPHAAGFLAPRNYEGDHSEESALLHGAAGKEPTKIGVVEVR